MAVGSPNRLSLRPPLENPAGNCQIPAGAPCGKCGQTADSTSCENLARQPATTFSGLCEAPFRKGRG
uniref:Uncharacterized protein n=1 Tax=Tanacetum cinerariifolium TaxID=118510 RepID=A0A699XDT7_TANCI|nr:hypothetical protein [Tanacetum cinerariifolium]